MSDRVMDPRLAIDAVATCTACGYDGKWTGPHAITVPGYVSMTYRTALKFTCPVCLYERTVATIAERDYRPPPPEPIPDWWRDPDVWRRLLLMLACMGGLAYIALHPQLW